MEGHSLFFLTVGVSVVISVVAQPPTLSSLLKNSFAFKLLGLTDTAKPGETQGSNRLSTDRTGFRSSTGLVVSRNGRTDLRGSPDPFLVGLSADLAWSGGPGVVGSSIQPLMPESQGILGSRMESIWQLNPGVPDQTMESVMTAEGHGTLGATINPGTLGPSMQPMLPGYLDPFGSLKGPISRGDKGHLATSTEPFMPTIEPFLPGGQGTHDPTLESITPGHSAGIGTTLEPMLPGLQSTLQRGPTFSSGALGQTTYPYGSRGLDALGPNQETISPGRPGYPPVDSISLGSAFNPTIDAISGVPNGPGGLHTTIDPTLESVLSRGQGYADYPGEIPPGATLPESGSSMGNIFGNNGPDITDQTFGSARAGQDIYPNDAATQPISAGQVFRPYANQIENRMKVHGSITYPDELIGNNTSAHMQLILNGFKTSPSNNTQQPINSNMESILEGLQSASRRYAKSPSTNIQPMIGSLHSSSGGNAQSTNGIMQPKGSGLQYSASGNVQSTNGNMPSFMEGLQSPLSVNAQSFNGDMQSILGGFKISPSSNTQQPTNSNMESILEGLQSASRRYAQPTNRNIQPMIGSLHSSSGGNAQSTNGIMQPKGSGLQYSASGNVQSTNGNMPSFMEGLQPPLSANAQSFNGDMQSILGGFKTSPSSNTQQPTNSNMESILEGLQSTSRRYARPTNRNIQPMIGSLYSSSGGNAQSNMGIPPISNMRSDLQPLTNENVQSTNANMKSQNNGPGKPFSPGFDLQNPSGGNTLSINEQLLSQAEVTKLMLLRKMRLQPSTKSPLTTF